jgi:hypothetical protein
MVEKKRVGSLLHSPFTSQTRPNPAEITTILLFPKLKDAEIHD